MDLSFMGDLAKPDTVANAVVVVSAVIAGGLLIGAAAWRGLSLGVAGVLFAGILAGHWGFSIEHHILHFMREFGLILFVSAIGIQVGPGFIAALRSQGLGLNLAAIAVVVMGSLIAAALVLAMGMPPEFVSGIYSGAVTNTPSLAAATQVMNDLAPGTANKAGMGYAIAYPFGIVGIIITMLLLKRWAKDPLDDAPGSQARNIVVANIEITRHDVHGVRLDRIPGIGHDIIVSRIRREGRTRQPAPDEILGQGDVLLAIGGQKMVADLVERLGKPATIDLRDEAGHLVTVPVVVTRKDCVGKTVDDLDLDLRFQVTVTRIRRADQEFVAAPKTAIQYGDVLTLVGAEQGVALATKAIGVQRKKFDTPHIFPLMVGIGLGVIVGSIPFFIPGLPVPVRMGLAGGPLLVALAFGAAVPAARLPHAALIMIKELGIALFLAAVGIKAGHGFVETLMSAQGAQGVAAGAVITIVPLLIVGAVMVFLMKLRFPAVCGVLAGSMTDPPALAFAQGYTRPDRVAAAYATVYPATMIGRILSGQLLVILLMAPAAGAVAAAGHGVPGTPAATSATAAPVAAPATAAAHP